ncbi:MAG: hypothetical protein ACREVS_04560 [Burkholderiales bacterium]
MASDIEVREGDAPDAAPATRIPDAVWINRPSSLPRGARLAVKTFAAAVVLGLVALAVKHTTTGSPAVVPSAIAGPDTGGAAGNGPTGYFPAQFDQRRLAPAEQPPTF